MNAKSHKDITSKVCDFLKLDEELKNILLKAVIIPDKNRDYTFKIKGKKIYFSHENHHKVNRDKIIDSLFVARMNFLSSQLKEAMWNLGIALHYIQDICMESGNLHDERESSLRISLIDNIKIKNIEEIKTFDNMKKLIYSIKSKRSSSSIIKDAYYYSLVVSKSIFTKQSIPMDLLEKYEKTKEEYNNKKYISLLILITSIILSLAVRNFILFIIGFTISVTNIIASQKEFEKIEKEVVWFGFNKES